jgi:hypothetical protein
MATKPVQITICGAMFAALRILAFVGLGALSMPHPGLEMWYIPFILYALCFCIVFPFVNQFDKFSSAPKFAFGVFAYIFLTAIIGYSINGSRLPWTDRLVDVGEQAAIDGVLAFCAALLTFVIVRSPNTDTPSG